jgi:hypothetical protein
MTSAPFFNIRLWYVEGKMFDAESVEDDPLGRGRAGDRP